MLPLLCFSCWFIPGVLQQSTPERGGSPPVLTVREQPKLRQSNLKMPSGKENSMVPVHRRFGRHLGASFPPTITRHHQIWSALISLSTATTMVPPLCHDSALFTLHLDYANTSSPGCPSYKSDCTTSWLKS